MKFGSKAGKKWTPSRTMRSVGALGLEQYWHQVLRWDTFG